MKNEFNKLNVKHIHFRIINIRKTLFSQIRTSSPKIINQSQREDIAFCGSEKSTLTIVLNSKLLYMFLQLMTEEHHKLLRLTF